MLVDSEPKRNALINFQEAHLFGLRYECMTLLVKGGHVYISIFFSSRILSSLVTCLDSFVFLESEYHFTDALLSLQADCNMADSSDVETLVPPSPSLPFSLTHPLPFNLA